MVQVTDTAKVLDGYTQTGDPDHFGQGGGVNDGKTTTPVILAPGDVFLNADFGYQPPAAENNSIGDTVWFDANADGVQGKGEPGIPGVTVALIKDTNGDGIWQPGEPIIAGDTTDTNGNYLFPGLPDGDYIVWVNDTDNVLGELVGTYDSNGGATATGSGAPTGADSSTVLGLSASSLDPTGADGNPVDDDAQDFGYTAPGQDTGEGLIGDTIFLDANGNGQPDPGEGIEGVVVQLVDPATGQVLATTTTDENGNYHFGGLPAGDYTVKVDTTTLPPGLTNTVDPQGTPGDNESTVTIGGAQPLINLVQDFGYQPSGGPGSIGNLVWQDSNADGVSVGPNGPDGLPGTDDDEPGIEGVTIDLYLDSDGNGVIDPGEPLVGSHRDGRQWQLSVQELAGR